MSVSSQELKKQAQRTSKSHKMPMGGGPPGGGIASGPAEKPKDFKKTVASLGQYLKPFTRKLIVVVVFAVMSTIFVIAGPKILGQATNQIVDDFINMTVYDRVTENLPAGTSLPAGTTGADIIKMMTKAEIDKLTSNQQDKLMELDLSTRPTFHLDIVRNIIILLLVLYVLSFLFSYIQGWIMTGVTQEVTYVLRKKIAKKINRLPLSYFDKQTYGEVLSRATNDVDTVSQTLNQSLSQIITSVVTLVGILAMMLSISWVLTLITILVLPISFLLIRLVTKYSQPQFVKQQQFLGDINGYIEEMYAGHLVMKAFNGERESMIKFNKLNDKLYGSGWRAQFFSGLMFPLMNFVGNLGYVGVSIAGGWLAINGHIKIGDIQAFIQYVQQFNQPIIQTANIANVLQSTVASAERVFEFLDEPEQTADVAKPEILSEIGGQVIFDHVSFGYTPGKPIIKDLSVIIEPGSRVAIVGPTGAGKTTLVNLLMRFYEVDGGAITIDGVNIKDMKRSTVREQFGMVLQDTWLFQGTIRENLVYGNPKISKKEMLEVALDAHVDRFVRSLPGGYDMEINEEADNISQGEKQLLTIARTMITKKPMLILDEATSSVDTRTESLIQEAMDRLMHGKTSFVIAHRLSTIRNADLILVMKDGDIIEQGNHQELMNQGGFYRDLYDSQFNN